MNDAPKEIWRPIEATQGKYEISNCGRLRSVDRIRVDSLGKSYAMRGQIRKPSLNACGYYAIPLTWDGQGKSYLIHRLVAECFLSNFSNKLEVNHIDGNKLNNHVSNLEMVTKLENMRHSYKHGLHNGYGENSNTAKLSSQEVREIIDKKGSDSRMVATEYNVSRSTITNIWSGRTWGTITGIVYSPRKRTK